MSPALAALVGAGFSAQAVIEPNRNKATKEEAHAFFDKIDYAGADISTPE